LNVIIQIVYSTYAISRLKPEFLEKKVVPSSMASAASLESEKWMRVAVIGFANRNEAAVMKRDILRNRW